MSPKQKQTHRHRQQTCACQGGGVGGGKDWECRINKCKFFFLYFFILRLIDLFYFWLCWVFVDAHGPSLAVENGASSLVVVHGVLISGSSCCRAWALGMRASVILARRL